MKNLENILSQPTIQQFAEHIVDGMMETVICEQLDNTHNIPILLSKSRKALSNAFTSWLEGEVK